MREGRSDGRYKERGGSSDGGCEARVMKDVRRGGRRNGVMEDVRRE